MNIALGSDHAGYELKQILLEFLKDKNNLIVKDFGPFSDDRADYPDYAHPVASAVEKGEFNFGILICGSGNGINMTANKHKGIRAALCWKKEIAELARLHNDANIISLPARYIDANEAIECVEIFLNTSFEGGRHSQRVDKIAAGC